jgi:hypothetical protein
MRGYESLNYLLQEKWVRIKFFRKNDPVHPLKMQFQEVILSLHVHADPLFIPFFRQIISPDLSKVVFLHESKDRDHVESIQLALFLAT